MGKMTKCKTCGADIAKSAKVCPACGAKQKKPVVLIVIAVFIAIGIIGTALGGNSPEKVGDTGAKGGNGSTAPQKRNLQLVTLSPLKTLKSHLCLAPNQAEKVFTHQTAATFFYFANLPLKTNPAKIFP